MAKENSKAVRDLTKEGLNIIAADDTFKPLSNNDLTKALAGNTMITNTGGIVVNVRNAPAGSIMPYQGEIDGEIVYFNSRGETDGGNKVTLASTTIDNKGTQGESQTRTEDEAEFVMNSLNYKEQVALRVLAAMIKHEPNPLNYDNSKIKLLVSASFRMAVEFQNRAIMFRKEESGGGGGSGEVDVDTDSLASNTEKILYNINENLKKGVAVKGSDELGASAVSVHIDNAQLATKGDVSSAESNIIAAMPSCKYEPPTK